MVDMTYSLTRAGYLTKESINTLDASDDLSEVKTEALLRAAVEKIDLVKIPHVIDDARKLLKEAELRLP